MNRNSPIGIFDSGVGGLTVVREIECQLPNESFVYFGDTARYPYGPRSSEIVREFARQDAQLLLSYGVKMLVVACNTASSVAMESLIESVSVPIIGVIEPGARAAVSATRSGRIGVIGTVGTISSNSYQRAIHSAAPNMKVVAAACPLFVSLAEEGFLDGEIPRAVALHYLTPLLEENIDTLILGCTHYPLLSGVIQNVVGKSVQLVDSASATVSEMARFLVENSLLRKEDGHPMQHFVVSDAAERFRRVGSRFLSHPPEPLFTLRLG